MSEALKVYPRVHANVTPPCGQPPSPPPSPEKIQTPKKFPNYSDAFQHLNEKQYKAIDVFFNGPSGDIVVINKKPEHSTIVGIPLWIFNRGE